jgi:PKD repeat protein
MALDLVIDTINAPIDPQIINSPVGVSATFTGPWSKDYEATWDWGDDTTSFGAIDGKTVSGSHTYTSPGVYTLSLTVTDDDGGSDTLEYQYIVVYDPEGGFVTGGGWFISPEGAYYPDPTLTGKATFGFVSKYLKGTTIPTGNTEFQFKVADLNFKSTEYQWLVVAGPKAMFKGVGTINGLGNYGFMISAVDEGLTPSTEFDLFRIKIWDMDNNDAVIYDNMLGAEDSADPITALGGGSIVIHKAK